MRKPIWFDSSIENFNGAPDVTKFGFARATLITMWGLYREVGGKYDDDHIDMDVCRRAANHSTYWKGREGHMIVLDEESLNPHVADLCQRDHIHDQLTEAVEIYRRAHPSKVIGYYGVLPQISYDAGYPVDSPQYHAWTERNQQFLTNLDDHTLAVTKRGVASVVDRVFPSIYWHKPLPESFDEWARLAEQTLIGAEIYQKPIIPYLMPLQYVDGEYPLWPVGQWQRMLQWTLARPEVTGVVVYLPTPGGTQWDENATWWKETLEVVNA